MKCVMCTNQKPLSIMKDLTKLGIEELCKKHLDIYVNYVKI